MVLTLQLLAELEAEGRTGGAGASLSISIQGSTPMQFAML